MEKYQIAQEIDLDLQQGDAPPVVKAVQYDNSCRVIKANIFNAGTAYQIPTDTVVKFQMTKKDGNSIENRCTFSGSAVYAVLTKQTLAFAGKYTARFYAPGGQNIRSMQILLSIGDGVDDDKDFVSMPENDTIVELAARIIEANTAAGNSAAAALASEGNAAKSETAAAASAAAANKSATTALEAKQAGEKARDAASGFSAEALTYKNAADASAESAAQHEKNAKEWAQTSAGPSTVVFSLNTDDGGLDVAIVQQ